MFNHIWQIPWQLKLLKYTIKLWNYRKCNIYINWLFTGPDIPGFLLQPFRKPKRIRTAFSPSQLLKLEHAFEKNHYVVGAERKQLAQALSLTETQVRIAKFIHINILYSSFNTKCYVYATHWPFYSQKIHSLNSH